MLCVIFFRLLFYKYQMLNEPKISWNCCKCFSSLFMNVSIEEWKVCDLPWQLVNFKMSHISYWIAKLLQIAESGNIWWRVWFCCCCFFFRNWATSNMNYQRKYVKKQQYSNYICEFRAMSLSFIFSLDPTWYVHRQRLRKIASPSYIGDVCVCMSVSVISVAVAVAGGCAVMMVVNRCCRCCFHVMNSDNGTFSNRIIK